MTDIIFAEPSGDVLQRWDNADRVPSQGDLVSLHAGDRMYAGPAGRRVTWQVQGREWLHAEVIQLTMVDTAADTKARRTGEADVGWLAIDYNYNLPALIDWVLSDPEAIDMGSFNRTSPTFFADLADVVAALTADGGLWRLADGVEGVRVVTLAGGYEDLDQGMVRVDLSNGLRLVSAPFSAREMGPERGFPTTVGALKTVAQHANREYSRYRRLTRL
jgi:hypothetical protein